MKRLMMTVATLCIAALPLSAFAAPSQTANSSQEKVASKAPVTVKARTKKSSAKKPAFTIVKGYVTKIDGGTFTLSNEKKGTYTVTTDKKTEVLGTNNKPVKLKTLTLPRIFEVTGMVTDAKKQTILASKVRAMPMKKGEGQVIGKVTIGPICSEQNGETKCTEEPFRAILTIKKQDGKEVKKVGSNEKGYFVVSLPAGTYILHPKKPNDDKYPNATDQTVKVTKGKFTLVTVAFDTGEGKDTTGDFENWN